MSQKNARKKRQLAAAAPLDDLSRTRMARRQAEAQALRAGPMMVAGKGDEKTGGQADSARRGFSALLEDQMKNGPTGMGPSPWLPVNLVTKNDLSGMSKEVWHLWPDTFEDKPIMRSPGWDAHWGLEIASRGWGQEPAEPCILFKCRRSGGRWGVALPLRAWYIMTHEGMWDKRRDELVEKNLTATGRDVNSVMEKRELIRFVDRTIAEVDMMTQDAAIVGYLLTELNKAANMGGMVASRHKIWRKSTDKVFIRERMMDGTARRGEDSQFGEKPKIYLPPGVSAA